jgi:glycosyltransferase involved in cell wall biosynthesis
MRVALIDPSNFTLPYNLALCSGLTAGGHEVHAFGRSLTEGDSWPQESIPLHLNFYRGLERLSWLPRPLFLSLKGVSHSQSMLRLRSRLNAMHPDIIHFQWFPLPQIDRLLLPALRRLAPVVLTMHDTDPFNGNPSAAVQRWGASALARQCDRVIVHTRAGALRLAEQGIERERIAVLPHGLLGDHEPTAQPAAGPVTFLVFGKIKPYKGIDVFVEAIARMPAGLRDQCRFVVAGKPYMDLTAIKAAVARHGLDHVVRFDLRYFNDAEIADLLAQASVMVFPYREIEASGVLAMALGTGRPIVATDIGGFSETFTNGVTAALVPPGDPDALAAALVEMAALPDERTRLGAAALELAASLKDWRSIADRTSDLYAAARAEWEKSPTAWGKSLAT